MTSSGEALLFCRECSSLAETVTFTRFRPAAWARSTPFRFRARARYSTPSLLTIRLATSSVSAMEGTALGWTNDPISILGAPTSAAASINSTFCSIESSVFSF